MKPLLAILSGLLLVWAQLSAAPTSPTPARPAHACCHCGGKMSCCAASSSGSRPVPAVPASTGSQKLISISTPAIVAPVLPETQTGLISSATLLPLMPIVAPLYARDCARLI